MWTVTEIVQALGQNRLTSEQNGFSLDDFPGPLALIPVVKQTPFVCQFCQPENSCVTLIQRSFRKQRNQDVTSAFSVPSKCCFSL